MTVPRDDVIAWIQAFAAAIAENKNHLTQLDSDIGDGDHGTNMDRGFQAVVAKLPELADKDIGAILKAVGMTLVSTVGGASGPLYGTFFLQAGTATSGKLELSLPDWTAALQAGVDGVILRGKANLGDKTMVDALVPALQSLKDAAARGSGFTEALSASAAACEQGMLATRIPEPPPPTCCCGPPRRPGADRTTEPGPQAATLHGTPGPLVLPRKGPA